MITIAHMQELTPREFGLYVILTDPVTGYIPCAEAAIQAEVKYLQLRMKNASHKEFLEVARSLRTLTRNTRTLLIINDSLEVAMEVDADGIHLGQADMPLGEARQKWQQHGKIYGLSTHNEQQAFTARAAGPDYIGVGPVFATPTKDIPDPVLGPALMGRIIKASPIPAVAIGGIDLTNLEQVLNQGAVNFSAVRPITQSTNPLQAIRALQQFWAARV